jgi:uncharacterized protein YneF (UPF0154 family)
MSLSPLIYWAVAFVILSLLGLFISAKTIKIDLQKNGELIVAMLTILGTLVSVLLGLLVSSANDQYQSLEECVNGESASVNQVFRLARGLPQPTASTLQNQCIEYCDRVLGEEWPSMKRGEMSASVSKILARLSDEVVQFHPNNDGESNIQSAIISAAANVGHDRGVRIVASRSSWTRRMLPLILTCAIVVLACSYLYAGKGSLRLHAVLVSLVAITLGTNIGVIFLMTRPFSSEWAIKPEGFELHVKAMRDYKNSPPHP